MRPGRRKAALSRRDLAVLDLERQWGQGPESIGPKLAIAEKELELSAGAYALVVNSLIDDPAAAAHDPQTVAQLRQVREARRQLLDEHPAAGEEQIA